MSTKFWLDSGAFFWYKKHEKKAYLETSAENSVLDVMPACPAGSWIKGSGAQEIDDE